MPDESSTELNDIITKLSLTPGDVIVVTSDRARKIAEDLCRASQRIDGLPACPVMLLQPGDTVEAVSRERLQEILDRTQPRDSEAK